MSVSPLSSLSRQFVGIAVLLSSLALVACDTDPEEVVEPVIEPSIAEVAVSRAELATFVTALEAADLTATVAGEGSFTVFAPSNDAFAALPDGALQGLIDDPDALAEVLQYHVVPGEMDSVAVVGSATLASLLGGHLRVTVDGDTVMVNDATIQEVDIAASNGVIHIIDRVLLPPAEEPEANTIIDVATAAGNFTTLLAAVEAANLTGTLADLDGNFTVFAPTDAAFDALPDGAVDALLADAAALTELLLFHVAGEELSAGAVLALDSVTTLAGFEAVVDAEATPPTIAGAPISATDIQTDNGAIHVLDAVMTIPTVETALGSIIDVATAAGNYTTLLDALEAAGLTETLADLDAEFTVFAPTDAAFAALPDGVVEALLADVPRLTELLLFHVSGEVLTAGEVLALGSVATVSGFAATVDGEATPPTIGLAPIGVTDIAADNGIIHSLDGVMTIEHPKTVLEIAAEAGGFSIVLTAIEVAGLTETLSDLDAVFTLFAPTDDAFETLPEGVLAELLEDTDALADLLLFHVVGEAYTAAEVLAADSIPTLAGLDAVVDAAAAPPTIAGAPISATDIAANNGIIHVLDAVMTPPLPVTIIDVANEAGSFTTLLAAVEAAGLTETLAAPDVLLTVFAPTDAAFDALPEGTVAALLADIPALTETLLYHVIGEELVAADVVAREALETLLGTDVGITVTEEGAFIGGALISATNVPTANGIIHVIDAVLIPPGNVVDVLVADPRFSTLVAAVTAASLELALVEPGPVTVFAPTDAAFDALAEGTVAALLGDIPALTQILFYHVVSGKLYAGDVVAETSLTTLEGSEAPIALDEEGARISGSLIIETNIIGSNGVIHVIDAVMLPMP